MGIEEIVFCSCERERDTFHVYLCVWVHHCQGLFLIKVVEGSCISEL